jgi:hypothetical protein
LPATWSGARTTCPGGGERGPLIRSASIRYLGFEATRAGREYTLSVERDGQSCFFVLVIPHAAFAARRARFQDGPDLCFAKLQRDLAADPALAPRAALIVSDTDLALYRDAQTKRVPERRRRGLQSGT